MRSAMPAYDWSCLACGQVNTAGIAACAQCACPALAKTHQIAEFRARHVQAGGEVRAGAALFPEPGELSEWRLLLFPLGLLLGYVPRVKQRDRQ